MDQRRIFITSPGDVSEERRRAAIVIQRIRREFSRFFDVSAILWEYDPMLSSGHFQDVIEKPSNTDIVVLILWARLGTALPERYRGIDGRAPVTGTEWEFEDALAAQRLKGSPDLLVYRKNTAPQAAFTDPAQMARAHKQWALVQNFWLRHFVERDGTFKAAFNQFSALDEFEQQPKMHLRTLLRDRAHRAAAALRPGPDRRGAPALRRSRQGGTRALLPVGGNQPGLIRQALTSWCTVYNLAIAARTGSFCLREAPLH